MPFESPITSFSNLSFPIQRFSDRQLLERAIELEKRLGARVNTTTFDFLYSGGQESISGLKSDHVDQIFTGATIVTRLIGFSLNNSFNVTVRRRFDNGVIRDRHDDLTIERQQNAAFTHAQIAKVCGECRDVFDALDAKSYLDFVDKTTQQVYESRDADLARLERMQESFFSDMTNFTLEQQKSQQKFIQDREKDHADRQQRLDADHAKRLKELDERENDLKRQRAELDERENRQARRDTYKEIKAKIESRYKSFELTEGTQQRRVFTFRFTLGAIAAFAIGFAYCFYVNVGSGADHINWVAVGSQFGFAAALIGMVTFFIRWNNHWFQKHADEEFKLKRLDLDIDRATWLVELCMEWSKMTGQPIPDEVTATLSRNLFVPDDSKMPDLHPAETALSALFGKAGKVNIETPANKFTVERSDIAAK